MDNIISNNTCYKDFAKRYGLISFALVFVVFLLFSSLHFSNGSFIQYAQLISKGDTFRPVVEKLISSGVDSAFIERMLQDPKVKFNEKFVTINVTGYLNKVNYSHFYNNHSVNKNKEFITNYNNQLTLAESTYKVPKEIIASIIWIETKHGSYLGNNNIVSVFFSTALCDEQKYINLNKSKIRNNPDILPNQYTELDKKIEERAKKKSLWAINEIIALEKMEKLSKTPIQKINGSWAGAFGNSQFLPSSYISWAKDGNNDGIINLFDMDDAIFSVANYLKSNGWSDDYNSQKNAVYHYNNSNDYVNAVFTLAKYSKT